MSDQLIITLGREFGSGGHAIAVELANRYGIKLYDHNLLDAVAAEKNVDVETLRRYDEKPRRLLFSRSQNGFSSSCLLYTSPSPRDRQKSRMPSSA